MSCSRENYGKEIYMLQTLRSWEIWTRQKKSMFEGSMQLKLSVPSYVVNNIRDVQSMDGPNHSTITSKRTSQRDTQRRINIRRFRTGGTETPWNPKVHHHPTVCDFGMNTIGALARRADTQLTRNVEHNNDRSFERKRFRAATTQCNSI